MLSAVCLLVRAAGVRLRTIYQLADSGRVIPRPFVKRFMHQLQEGQLDRDEARLVCEENGSPTAMIFAAAVRKWGRPAVEVEQAVIDSGERACGDLRRYLRVFNGLVTIGPLLGIAGHRVRHYSGV